MTSPEVLDLWYELQNKDLTQHWFFFIVTSPHDFISHQDISLHSLLYSEYEYTSERSARLLYNHLLSRTTQLGLLRNDGEVWSEVND